MEMEWFSEGVTMHTKGSVNGTKGDESAELQLVDCQPVKLTDVWRDLFHGCPWMWSFSVRCQLGGVRLRF